MWTFEIYDFTLTNMNLVNQSKVYSSSLLSLFPLGQNLPRTTPPHPSHHCGTIIDDVLQCNAWSLGGFLDIHSRLGHVIQCSQHCCSTFVQNSAGGTGLEVLVPFGSRVELPLYCWHPCWHPWCLSVFGVTLFHSTLALLLELWTEHSP